MILLVDSGFNVIEEDKLYLFDNDDDAEAFAGRPASGESQPTQSTLRTSGNFIRTASRVSFYRHDLNGPTYFFAPNLWIRAIVHPVITWGMRYFGEAKTDRRTELYEKRMWPYSRKKWYRFSEGSTMNMNDMITAVDVNNEVGTKSLIIVLYEHVGYKGRTLRLSVRADKKSYFTNLFNYEITSSALVYYTN